MSEVMPPDFRIPISDEHEADFWFDEWLARWIETGDHAFKEQADAMRRYIFLNFDKETSDA